MLALRAAPAFVPALAAPASVFVAATEALFEAAAGEAASGARVALSPGAAPFDYARQSNEALRGIGARWPLNEARFA